MISCLAVDEGLKAALWRPLYLRRSAWLEHIPFAFWLMSQHKPRLAVELGTHYGSSYFAFCQAVESLSLDARCFAIDTWKGDEHAGFYGEDVYASVSAHNAAFYSHFSTLTRATFSDTAQYFDERSIDLLHLDGLHTEDSVRKDVEMWLPKLSDRGVLLLHDTNVREREFGVRNVLMELRQKYPVFEFTHGHGLGLVGIGNNLSQEVRDLLDAETHSTVRRDITAFFAKLGHDCSNAYKVEKMEQERLAGLAAKTGESQTSPK